MMGITFLAVACVGWVAWAALNGGTDPRDAIRWMLLGAAGIGLFATLACLFGNRPFRIGGAPLPNVDELQARGVALIRVSPHEEDHAEDWQKGWVLVLDEERALTVPILAMNGSRETLGRSVRMVARPGGGLWVLASHEEPIGISAELLDDRSAAWATAATHSMVVNFADMPAALREACLKALAESKGKPTPR